MRIALAQMSMTPDPEENLKKCIKYLDRASQKQARLICFPELQFSPFFPQYPGRDASRYLMDIEHPLVKRFREAVAAAGLITVSNFYLRTDNGNYDASPVFGQKGELLGISKMVHIVQIPLFYEQDYYTPSDDGFKVYQTPAGKTGVVICFDRHFPESIRSCALMDAELILVPTAVVENEPLEKFVWEMRIAAMQNRVYIAMCNRSGREGDVLFCGSSFVVNPEGDCVKIAGKEESLVLTDIEPLQGNTGSIHPYLRLRRPDMYKV